jgi:uncharacterized SAM-dependent methyltransferase
LEGILGSLLSELKPDHIEWAFAMVEKLLLSGDYIVRGADHCGKVANLLQIVTKTAKGLDIGHAIAPLLSEYNRVAVRGQ